MTSKEMAKIGCHDCKGCYSCCTGMGDSVWVDPYDAYRITQGLGKSLQELMEGPVSLHVEDGLIMPNIRMSEAGDGDCFFLDENHRCSIHDIRPGFCRLFPLGRNYDGDKLTYFILEDACPMPNKTKVRISKWIGEEQYLSYEKYLITWHGLTKSLRAYLQREDVEDERKKRVNMQFLQCFYMVPYEPEGDDATEIYQLIEQRVKEFYSIIQ